MNIRIHSKHGQSFRGVAEYLLDVLKPEEERRVEWVETRNLGTQDGMTASRVMAATAYNQNDLKASASIGPQGRKMKGGPVMHYSIAWEEHEVEGLTREQMIAAAELTLAKIGKDNTRGKNVPKYGGRRQFADQHQAFIVCHNDKAHPHVHIVVNRVHPEHGVMLPDYNDWLKLSKVGLKFEKENDKIVSPERVINWEARDNGLFVKYTGHLPRQTWEAMQNLSPEMQEKAKVVIEAERKQAATIAKAARDQKSRHQDEWGHLEQHHFGRATRLVRDREQALKDDRKSITERSLQVRREQLHDRQAELAAFELREQTALGKLRNRMRGIDLKSLVGLDKGTDPDGRAKTWAEAFNILGSSGAALGSLKTKHEINQKQTNRQEKRELRLAKKTSQTAFTAKLAGHRQTLAQERKDLIFKQRLEVSKTRAEWKQFDQGRSTRWEPLRSLTQKMQQARQLRRPTKGKGRSRRR